ncbi:MAG: hypothetical protein IBX47_11555 [Desulfuromonadales bacterium]|nr:hypothetical protein [Desulfuromonadales bacterium]
MNKNAIENAKDRDMASSFVAIRRAAKRARQVAVQTGTSLIVRQGEQFDRITVTDYDELPKHND